jgi:hypothetical protein
MCLKKIQLLKRNDNFVVGIRVDARHLPALTSNVGTAQCFGPLYRCIAPQQMKDEVSIKTTSSNNTDFELLVAHLDNELWYELNEDQAQYDPYNKVPDLQTVVVLYVNGKPAACGCFKKHSADTVEIKRMFVEKENRGKGLSKMVLAELEKWATENQARFAILETSIHFAAARNLYLNAGYQVIPNYDQYIGLPESVCMKKELIETRDHLQPHSIEYFRFEEDFVEEGIRCIPMIVRFKLDNAGIKLALKEWATFNNEEKFQLALMECNNEEAVKKYRATVVTFVKKYTGKDARTLSIENEPGWNNDTTVPGELLLKAAEAGVNINTYQWKSLTILQRFALLKLCRSGHENRNFPIALKEFGLMQ